MTAAIISFAPLVTGEPLPAANAGAGGELYWHGTTPTGTPIQATIANDIKVDGSQFSCVNCHRPSGFGSSEGGKYVPPVTGPVLFSARQLDRNRIYHKLFEEAQSAGFAADVRMPRMRPAYTDQTLGDALRKGVDPTGRQLDPQMPRYQLNDSEVANLSAYLKTLSVMHSPGVDSKDIHFATIISDGVDLGERTAVINTISAFVDWMNRATHGYQSRPGFSPYHMSELASAFRQWRLHVWELHGQPDTWQEQLMRQYENQPVFAIVSGLVHGPFRPIAQFCEANRIPCVFPNTELPGTANTGFNYSIYFSRGLELEGEVLANYLSRESSRIKRMALLWSADPYGVTPALAFKQAITKKLPDVQLQEFEFSSGSAFKSRLRELAATADKIDALVIWPGDQVDAVLAELGNLRSGIKIITLPSGALAHVQSKVVGDRLSKKLLFAYPYELPLVYHPRSFRVRQWMHAQHLEITKPKLQYQTYYGMTLVEFALDQIVDDFFRDYFIESIEHLAENNLAIGTHPTLALGPGQRFASKGAYIVKIEPKAPGGIKALSDWIVP